MSDCGCNKCNDIIQVTPACPCPDPTPPTKITSTGDSITVTHTGIIDGKDTWNVEKSCCADNKVSVDGSDTPAFLEAQLGPSVDNAIKRQKVDGPDGTKIMIPVLDQTKITDSDKLVAAAAGCTPGYLTATLTTNDNAYFGRDIAGCKTRLLTKPRKILIFRSKLFQEQTTSFNDDTTGFWFQESTNNNAVCNIPTALSTVAISGGYTAHIITIPRTGRYSISLQGSYTITGTHTIRNQIWKYDGSRPGILLLDAREEGAWRLDQNNNDLIDTQAELNKEIAKIANDAIADADGEELSISYSMRGLGFGGTTLEYLTVGDKLMMGFKYDTTVKDEFRSKEGSSVTFTSSEFDESTRGKGAGTGWSIHEIPEYSLTD